MASQHSSTKKCSTREEVRAAPSAKQLTLAREVLRRLKNEYPDAGTMLRFSGPYQALVAVIISAQTTDRQVNRVTPALFAAFPEVTSLAAAPVEKVAELIRSVGLYRSKAAHLVTAAGDIVGHYAGRVPDTFEELLKLPGVGRKTANVLLSVAFGKPGLGVDTHVHRVANRIGLVCSQRAIDTEKQLKRLIPASDWGQAHHLLIFHGRRVCRAPKPACNDCLLQNICQFNSSR